MASGAVELQADIAEVKSMLEKAKRQGVRKELERVLAKLSSELETLKVPAAAPAMAAPAPVAAAPAAAPKVAAAPAPAHVPAKVDVRAAGPWTEITTFAQDLGGYDKPAVSIDIRLKGIEALPAESVTCDFTPSSFDLRIMGLDGKNHRMLKTNLDKDIVVPDSSVRVKKNHVIVTLQKVKGQYGYESWSDLCAKGGKRREAQSAKTENPQDSIMGMMKDLYDDGDDSMKKIIGEAMYKAKRGEKYDPAPGEMKANSGLDDL